jgi:hypothetical protein
MDILSEYAESLVKTDIRNSRMAVDTFTRQELRRWLQRLFEHGPRFIDVVKHKSFLNVPRRGHSTPAPVLVAFAL